jgi:hypothetical protein
MSILYEKDVWNKNDVHSLENVEGFTIFGDGKEPPTDTTTNNTKSMFSSNDKTDDTAKDTTDNTETESTKDKIGSFFSSNETKTNDPKTDNTQKTDDKLESMLPSTETPVNNRDAKKFIVRILEMFIGFLVGIVTVAYILFTSTHPELYEDDNKTSTPDKSTEQLLKEGFAAVFKENAEHTFKFCMELAQLLSKKVDSKLNNEKNRFDLLYIFMTFIVLMMMIANPAILGVGYVLGYVMVTMVYSIIASFTFNAGLFKYFFPIIAKLVQDAIAYITDPKHWKILIITIVVLFFFGSLLFGLTKFIPTLFRYLVFFIIGIFILGIIITTFFTMMYMGYFVFTTFVNKNLWELAKKIFFDSKKLILILMMYGIGYNMLNYLSGYSIPTGLFQLSIGTFLAYFLFGLATLLGGSFAYEYIKGEKNITDGHYSIFTIVSIVFGYLMAGFW